MADRVDVGTMIDWIELPHPHGLDERNHVGQLIEQKARQRRAAARNSGEDDIA